MYGVLMHPAMRGLEKVISLCLVQSRDKVLTWIRAGMPGFLSIHSFLVFAGFGGGGGCGIWVFPFLVLETYTNVILCKLQFKQF